MFAEILMPFGTHSGLKRAVASRLIDLLKKTDADFKPEELSRFCEQIFRSKEGNSADVHNLLFDPTLNWPTEVSRAIDALVLSVLRSRESLPDEVAHAMEYLFNAESLARLQKDAVPAIEKILMAMSNDERLRSADAWWEQASLSGRSERAQEFDRMFVNANRNIPYSIFILRFISAANLTADLAQPIRELAKGCMNSIQPVEPELLTIRLNSINTIGWEVSSIYSLKSKPLEWKKDFFAFHASVRLLQSNRLAEIKDFVPNGPATVDWQTWHNANRSMTEFDTDRSGDLDKDEFWKNGDFAVVDKDTDGALSEVEVYRYLMELAKQKTTQQSAVEIQSLATALIAYHGKTGAFPNSLSALWTKPDDAGPDWMKYVDRPVKNDPWGNPYKYVVDGTRFRIRSNGPDGIENTVDDLMNLE